MAYHRLVTSTRKFAPNKKWASQHPQDREQHDVQGHAHHHDDEDEAIVIEFSHWHHGQWLYSITPADGDSICVKVVFTTPDNPPLPTPQTPTGPQRGSSQLSSINDELETHLVLHTCTLLVTIPVSQGAASRASKPSSRITAMNN